MACLDDLNKVVVKAEDVAKKAEDAAKKAGVTEKDVEKAKDKAVDIAKDLINKKK